MDVRDRLKRPMFLKNPWAFSVGDLFKFWSKGNVPKEEIKNYQDKREEEEAKKLVISRKIEWNILKDGVQLQDLDEKSKI